MKKSLALKTYAISYAEFLDLVDLEKVKVCPAGIEI